MSLLFYDDSPVFGGHEVMALLGLEAVLADFPGPVRFLAAAANVKLCEKVAALAADGHLSLDYLRPDGGIDPGAGWTDTCVNGMALGFCAVFVALSLYLLPRFKGVFVGVQWAKRMGGFGGVVDFVSDALRRRTRP